MQALSRTVCRLALAACVGFVGNAALAASSRTVGADSSTWYWQNPLPHPYSIGSIACRSITSCVAVGRGGSVVTTDDGGRHWTDRHSGTSIDLGPVTCPGRSICYTVGSNTTVSNGLITDVQNVLLTSADGGKTWRHLPSPPLTNPHQFLGGLACPTSTTCLVMQYDDNSRASSTFRTTDGGKTWHAVNVPGLQRILTVTCATRTVCYATGSSTNRDRILRSEDGGKTWIGQGLVAPAGLMEMACPQAGTCFAVASNCGAECDEGDIFLSTNGARTWKRVASHPTGNGLRDIACPSVTTCYVGGDTGLSGLGGSVVATTNGGKSWSVHRLPDPAGVIACPGHTTCFVAADFTVLQTSDGFHHTQEALARSVVHDLDLMSISCPTTTSCFAAAGRNICPGSGPCSEVAAPFVTTSDGGRNWRQMSPPPKLLGNLACPGSTVCYAISEPGSGTPALDRTIDGAKTWQQLAIAAGPSEIWDISCVSVTTCFLVTSLLTGSQERFAVLVTHDGGSTWTVHSGIDAVARAGATDPDNQPDMAQMSCPSVTTCFVLATVTTSLPPSSSSQGWTLATEVVSTTDGGATWSRHTPALAGTNNPPGTWVGQALTCPTATTCYIISSTEHEDNGVPMNGPGPVLVTHDAGATWRGTSVSSAAYLDAITCATAQACRVTGSAGMFATEDGGATWTRQFMADGESAPGLSIACPAIDTCYAVGGLDIVAAHPPQE